MKRLISTIILFIAVFSSVGNSEPKSMDHITLFISKARNAYFNEIKLKYDPCIVTDQHDLSSFIIEPNTSKDE